MPHRLIVGFTPQTILLTVLQFLKLYTKEAENEKKKFCLVKNAFVPSSGFLKKEKKWKGCAC